MAVTPLMENSMNLKLVAALAALLSLTACGGAGSSSFDDATPSYAALAMDLTSGDVVGPAPAVAPEGATPSALTAAGAALTIPADCHPHLFQRTSDVVRRVNRHLWRALRHAERAIAAGAPLVVGAERVWERVEGGIDRKFTMTRTGDATFTWKLELKKVTDAAFVTVVSGSIDRSGAQARHEGQGSLSIDLGALAAVSGDDVAGLLEERFSNLAGTRTVEVTATGVVWDADANAGLVRAPRSAHYVYERQPGKGGSLKIEEQMAFGCPLNPGALAADVKLVSRWYRTASGSVHGRSDAIMTGGQLAATNQMVGVTCHQSAAEGEDQAEGYWLMKVEDTSSVPPGVTVTGGARDSGTAGVSACDPAYGAVPSLTDASSDFAFAAVDFAGAAPYPFLP